MSDLKASYYNASSYIFGREIKVWTAAAAAILVLSQVFASLTGLPVNQPWLLVGLVSTCAIGYCIGSVMQGAAIANRTGQNSFGNLVRNSAWQALQPMA
jgi:hypothetical protein